MHIYTYIYIYIYIHTHTHIYIHTHTHLQAPIMISVFLSLKRMAEAYPSMTTGGALWFTDLSVTVCNVCFCMCVASLRACLLVKIL